MGEHSNLSSLASAEAVAAAKKAQQEMYQALLAKREVLVDGLEGKLTRYKELLLKEMVRALSYCVCVYVCACVCVCVCQCFTFLITPSLSYSSSKLQGFPLRV